MIGIRANDGTLVNAAFIQEYRISHRPHGEKYQLEAIFGRKADNELDSIPLVIGTQQECLLGLEYLSDCLFKERSPELPPLERFCVDLRLI